MKRTLLIGMSVLVCAAFLAIASTNEVTSVNVVGYSKTDRAPGLQMWAPVFYNGSNTLQDVLGSNGTANVSETAADNVWIYVPGPSPTYLRYWLCDSTPGPQYDHQWINYDGFATNVLLPGQGFWVMSRSLTTNVQTFLGEVVDEGAITNTIINGLQMLGYAFSCDRSIGDLTCTNGKANVSETAADNIWVYDWKTKQYSRFWLCDSTPGPEYNHKWINYDGFATNLIKMGQAFWYMSRTNATVSWVESRPYLNN